MARGPHRRGRQGGWAATAPADVRGRFSPCRSERVPFPRAGGSIWLSHRSTDRFRSIPPALPARRVRSLATTTNVARHRVWCVVRWGWGCGVRWRRAVGSRGCGWMGAFAGAGPWPRRPGGFDRSHWLARVRGSACGEVD